MSDAAFIALITGVPSILTSLATLIYILKGNSKMDKLDGAVNGKFTEMLDMVRSSSEVKGKVETIEKIIQHDSPSATIITSDRRKN